MNYIFIKTISSKTCTMPGRLSGSVRTGIERGARSESASPDSPDPPELPLRLLHAVCDPLRLCIRNPCRREGCPRTIGFDLL